MKNNWWRSSWDGIQYLQYCLWREQHYKHCMLCNGNHVVLDSKWVIMCVVVHELLNIAIPQKCNALNAVIMKSKTVFAHLFLQISVMYPIAHAHRQHHLPTFFPSMAITFYIHLFNLDVVGVNTPPITTRAPSPAPPIYSFNRRTKCAMAAGKNKSNTRHKDRVDV